MTERNKIMFVVCRWKDTVKSVCTIFDDKCVSEGNDPHKCPYIPQDLLTFVITLERQRNHLESEVDYYVAQIENHVRKVYEEHK